MFNVQAGLLSVAVINAVYNVIAEIVGKVQGINPIVFSLYRDAAAAPILSSIALAQNRERVFPDRADVARIAVQGFLGIFLNQILFLLGVEWTNGTTGSICNLTLPVFAHAISVSLRLEKLKWATAAGLGLCIVGALVMKVGAESRGTSQERPFLGISVLLLGSLCSALYCIIQKKSLKKYSAVFVTSWEYIFGFLFMLLSALAFADYDRESWKLTEVGILALAFTVLFNSGKILLCFTFAVPNPLSLSDQIL